jgi:hypothetical protein
MKITLLLLLIATLITLSHLQPLLAKDLPGDTVLPA